MCEVWEAPGSFRGCFVFNNLQPKALNVFEEHQGEPHVLPQRRELRFTGTAVLRMG